MLSLCLCVSASTPQVYGALQREGVFQEAETRQRSASSYLQSTAGALLSLALYPIVSFSLVVHM